jgi:hypothetical protein
MSVSRHSAGGRIASEHTLASRDAGNGGLSPMYHHGKVDQPAKEGRLGSY